MWFYYFFHLNFLQTIITKGIQDCRNDVTPCKPCYASPAMLYPISANSAPILDTMIFSIKAFYIWLLSYQGKKVRTTVAKVKFENTITKKS